MHGTPAFRQARTSQMVSPVPGWEFQVPAITPGGARSRPGGRGTTLRSSQEQPEQLRSFPDIGRDDLIRYFTLTQADVGFVDPGRGRGPADRLGLAVQLCTPPWLGFVPDEASSAPPVAVARLAERLGLDPEVLEGYGRRSHTRSDHLLLVAKYLGWKSAPAGRGEMPDWE